MPHLAITTTDGTVIQTDDRDTVLADRGDGVLIVWDVHRKTGPCCSVRDGQVSGFDRHGRKLTGEVFTTVDAQGMAR